MKVTIADFEDHEDWALFQWQLCRNPVWFREKIVKLLAIYDLYRGDLITK